MTKHTKFTIKLGVLSLALTVALVMLDGVRKNGTVEGQVLGGMAEFVVGMFALIAVVGTIVNIFIEEN